MNTITLASIIIPADRQRQEFDPTALIELRESIQENPAKPHAQLQNAPVLRKTEEGWVLVSGERRIKSILDIFALGGSFIHNGTRFTADAGLIPFTDIGQLDRLAAEEAELDENFRRRDLTWQEHAAAVKRLHELRSAQKAASTDAILVDPAADPIEKLLATTTAPQQSVADTALEVYGASHGDYGAKTKRELLVAQHLSNPEVAKAKDIREAEKIIKREETRRETAMLAAAMGTKAVEDTFTILNTDCIAWMADPANHGQFDVILTDAPYGMGAQDFGDGGGKMTGIDHQYDDSFGAWQQLMTGRTYSEKAPQKFGKKVHEGWTQLAFRIAKPEAHAYVFCDIENFPLLKDWMTDAGWDVFRTPLIAYKLNSGRVPRPDHGPRRQYETILFAIKGNKKVTGIFPDVIPCEGDENMGHGAQKPVALFENLLRRSVKPGDRVVDTFAGSGPLVEAAARLNVYSTLLEAVPAYYGMCLQRAERLKASAQTSLSLNELMK